MSKSSSKKLTAALNYCASQVRMHDYKSYLCLINLPREQRPAAFALRAFNIDIVSSSSSPRDPRIAALRLAWWRDSISAVYAAGAHGQPDTQSDGNPVLTLLAHHRSQLSKHWLTRLIDARSPASDTARLPPPDIPHLERHAEATSSPLLYLTLEAAGVRDARADHAASHAGKAAGIAALLADTRAHCAARVCCVPSDVAARCGVAHEDFYRAAAEAGGDGAGIARAVYEVATVAHSHLEKARELAREVPREARAVLLPAVPTEQYLRKLMELRFNPFDPRLQRGVCGASPLWMLLKLKWCAIRGIY